MGVDKRSNRAVKIENTKMYSTEKKNERRRKQNKI